MQTYIATTDNAYYDIPKGTRLYRTGDGVVDGAGFFCPVDQYKGPDHPPHTDGNYYWTEAMVRQHLASIAPVSAPRGYAPAYALGAVILSAGLWRLGPWVAQRVQDGSWVATKNKRTKVRGKTLVGTLRLALSHS